MTPSDIEQIYEEFHTPKHVRQHCLQVALVGEFLANALNEAGMEIDASLVWQGGMLHDVVRVVDFKKLPRDLGTKEDQMVWKKLRADHVGKHHGAVAAEILRERGEEALADIIARHQTGLLGTPQGPNSWESKLLFYADKRVRHHEIVSLQERLEEGWNRHFNGRAKEPSEETIEAGVYALEREIFERLPFGPDEVMKVLK